MTWFDIVVIVVLLVSALAGFVRGGAREIVTLVAFTLSALVAALLLPFSGPMFRKMIDPDWVGTVMAAVVVFVVAYLLIRLLGAWVSQKLQTSERLGGVDRMVGLSFGVVRALVLLGFLHLLFAATTPVERQPHWFRGATFYPVTRGAAKAIQAVVPKGAKVADRVAPKVEQSVRRGATDRPQSPSKGPRGYDQGQRQSMDALVERSR
jgi:membrane protein required for colicin V production